MIDSKDFEYLVGNTKSVEGLEALNNLASAEQDKREKLYDEIGEQIKILEKEKKELEEEYGRCLRIHSIIKRKIADLVVGGTECSE